MNIKNLQRLQNNIDSHAYIARELEGRLLEHLPQSTCFEKKLDILRQCSAQIIMDGMRFHQEKKYDAIIAHLIPLWQKNLELSSFFQEIYRLLDARGIFLFSTLGQGLPYELEALGDLLVKTGFKLPVVDREYVQLHYDDMNVLQQDLELSGLMQENVKIKHQAPDDIIVTVEIIYGYVQEKNAPISSSGVVEIPIANIKLRY